MPRPEFEQVVASAPREKVKRITVTGATANLEAGQVEVIEIFGSPNTICEPVMFECLIPAVNSAITDPNETHTLTVTKNDRGAFLLGRARGSSDIKFAYQHFEKADLEVLPKTEIAQIESLRCALFDSVDSFQIRYFNNCYQPQQNKPRNFYLVYREKAIG